MAAKTKTKTKTKTKAAAKSRAAKPKGSPAPTATTTTAKDDKVEKIIAALKAGKLTPAEIATKADCSLKYARRLVHRVIRKARKLDVVVERDEKRGNVYSIA